MKYQPYILPSSDIADPALNIYCHLLPPPIFTHANCHPGKTNSHVPFGRLAANCLQHWMGEEGRET